MLLRTGCVLENAKYRNVWTRVDVVDVVGFGDLVVGDERLGPRLRWLDEAPLPVAVHPGVRVVEWLEAALLIIVVVDVLSVHLRDHCSAPCINK